MKHELSDLYEGMKTLKKQDVKNTEKKIEKDVTDLMGGNEITFINDFLKKGEKIDGKTVKSIDMLIKLYKQKKGLAKLKNDANMMMLAPIIASIYAELNHQ